MGIVLLGYRGSGKTTVGRKLADKLWCDFVDADEEIVRKAGKSIKEIFATDGEAAFRDLESEVLADLLNRDNAVISCGGGIILRETNRQALIASTHARVYLRCEPETLLNRIEADPATAESRPALTNLGGSLDEVRTLLAAREPLYRQAMTAELEVTNLTADEAVIRITKLV